MATPKYFKVELNGDVLIFTAMDQIGGLVEDAAREEWDAHLRQLESNSAKHAVVDLGALDFFGSIMLELLVVLWKRVSAKDGKMALCCVSPVGVEILKTAKFDTLWAILPERETALDEVSA